MSLEQRLLDQYQKSARIADMGGYGLSGGMQDQLTPQAPGMVLNTSLQALTPEGSKMYARRVGGARKKRGGAISGGDISSGGALSGGFPWLALAPIVSAVVPEVIKAIKGQGIEISQRGSVPPPFYGGAYDSSSFPAPGFYPGPLRASGGSRAQSSWVQRVKKYAAEQGISYKDAMIALKGTQ